ncbi:MAG: redoxin domain-containing protein [Chloroflexota bacterium]|nr:redoxin domain-containing protein [Chloroflexota bacterium]
MSQQDATATRGTDYNYREFTPSEARGRSAGFMHTLRAGDEAPDFDLPTPEGDRIRLSDFRGQSHVVLEFGSIT